MTKKTMLASFGVRALSIFRAIVVGDKIDPATVETLVSIGWASVLQDGAVVLTIAGQEAHAMLEKLDAVPEEHVELLERLAGPTTPGEARELASEPRPARNSLFGPP